MSDGALTVLDGTHLRTLDLSLSHSFPDDVTLTPPQVLDLADAAASSALFDVPLPPKLKSSASKRVNLLLNDAVSPPLLDRQQSLQLAADYVAAIADELKDDPIVISILDGNTIRLFLEDEDDFAMLAENLFTDLDAEDKGKLNKSEIRSALVHMGVEMGVPPISEFPPLGEILMKHEAHGEEELGQAQFAELLQPILQELAEALAKKHVVYTQNIKIVNGSKLRKLLADEKQLSNVVEKILLEKKDGLASLEVIRSYLDKNGLQLGLPPSEGDEAVAILYDLVFAELEEDKSALKEGEDKFGDLVKKILEELADQLEANPVFHDTEN